VPGLLVVSVRGEEEAAEVAVPAVAITDEGDRGLTVATEPGVSGMNAGPGALGGVLG
jgi:hypothetical protein